MKKIIVFMLSMTASLAVTAAAFDWKVPDASEHDIGYRIYAVLGNSTTESWANEAALTAASIGGKCIAEVSDKGRYIGGSGTVIDDSVKSDTSFYLVIVDAASTKFASSQIYDASTYVYTPPDQGTDVASFSVAGISYTTFGTEPVPEPTSGLLVLVGLAGLMLRRKRT